MKKYLALGILGLIATMAILYAVTPVSTLYQYLIATERSIAHLEVKRLNVDELEIEYLRGGSGPTLVLLHGFGADKDNWSRIARYLVDDFDVIAIDLPGFGNSTKDISLNYDVGSQVARLKRITDVLGLDTFSIAGSSMGGYIAGNFAVKYPEAVKNLWLISPLGVEGAQASEMFIATQHGAAPVVLPRTDAEFSALLDALFVEAPFIPSPIVSYLSAKAVESVELNSKIFEQIHRMRDGKPHPDAPLDIVLTHYTGPVLITWGDKDRVLHVSGAAVLKGVVPQARVNILADVGHLPMVESPDVTADAFLAFAAASQANR
ncbi:alpha/beta hydrolase [Shewanella khirikhana]|uniref:alpha/beta fold hydrolase n=1 Tax=Shewanella khirikhana TaxID=1965282 RepID=UPI0030D1F40A